MVIDLRIYYHVPSKMVSDPSNMMDPWIYYHVASNMVMGLRMYYPISINIFINA